MIDGDHTITAIQILFIDIIKILAVELLRFIANDMNTCTILIKSSNHIMNVAITFDCIPFDTQVF